ncbi:glycoside hydrolase family 32 protein [Cellulosimicrobium cellulans]|uniref:glycoside hydrolase family 32 protein n=1 Tax=Cellulosimicrobium cellulans TaxID=1710 RepID=UPI002149FCE6|nr:glycoside hydrolase family 32 protein [Cellulosimicrobium cellulans]
MQPTSTEVPRPRFHFTPRRHWMSDPNGLVHHGGLWHLYFQHNPEGLDWGNMSWGHATSPDLQHWTEHPVALAHRTGEQIFSGSVVASRADCDVLTAYYTSAYDDGHQAQSRATSDDGGFTWRTDPGNPVLDRGTIAFRDPKVIRYDDGHAARWVMLTVEADDRQVLLYSSDDLVSWEHLSTFGPVGATGVVWECPDLVKLPLDGDTDDPRWVLLLSTNPVGDDPDPAGSSMHYIVGYFDGTTFVPDFPELRRLDHGRDYYAAVTFDDAPGREAVTIGWMSNWRYAHAFPTAPWRGAMSLPRTLTLRTVQGRATLVQAPPAFVREHLEHAASTSVAVVNRPAELSLTGHSLLELRWDPASTGTLRMQLRGAADAFVDLVHAPGTGSLRLTRGGPAAEAVHPDFPSTTTVPLPGDRPARLLLSLDGPLLEVFVADGEETASNLVLLGAEGVIASLETARPGTVHVTAVDVEAPTDVALPAPAAVLS